MQTVDTGKIIKIERGCTHDGPGIRTVVYFKGCPLRCAWCSNVEGTDSNYSIMFNVEKCISCNRCLNVCPVDTIRKLRRQQRDDSNCLGYDCKKCVECCPTQALTGVGYEISSDELMRIILSDYNYYEESGGGVTFTGGEVLFQPGFLKTMLTKAKNAGIDTAIETSGFAPTQTVMELLPLIDHVIMDIKHMDSNMHKKYTSVPNEQILKNAKAIAQAGKDITISFPFIPGANDSEENINALGLFVRDELKTVKTIKLLPYHNYGEVKYDRLGKHYEYKGVKRHSKEELLKAKEMLLKYVDNVSLRA